MPRKRLPPEKLAQLETMRANLVLFRHAAGLSQEVAAQLVGLTLSSLQKLERGSRGLASIEIGTMQLFADVYGRRVDDFLVPHAGILKPPDRENRRTVMVVTVPGIRLSKRAQEEVAVLLAKLESETEDWPGHRSQVITSRSAPQAAPPGARKKRRKGRPA